MMKNLILVLLLVLFGICLTSFTTLPSVVVIAILAATIAMIIVFKFLNSKSYKIRKALKNYNIDTFIAIDTETTGLFNDKHEIIEIAAVKYKNGEIKDEFTTLVKPKNPIPLEAVLTHNITDKMVAKAPIIEQVMPQFLNFIGNDLLVAHNMEFDYGFISQHAKITNQKICTLEMARKTIAGIKNYKLITLIEHFDIDANPNHRSLSDAIACGELFKELILLTYEKNR